MNRSNQRQAAGKLRRDIEPAAHTDDSYRSPKRIRSGTGCSECGAVYDNGRWVWNATADVLEQLICPACKRIRDHAPVGEITLAGDYVAQHRDDIVRLLNNQAKSEEGDHPLERLIAIDTRDGALVVETTGPHLVRRLGEALLRAHHGTLTVSYRDGEGLLRAYWTHEHE